MPYPRRRRHRYRCGQDVQEKLRQAPARSSPEVISGADADMERLELARIPGDHPPDILIGGPPCQAFSRIGRGKLDSLSEEGFVGDPRNKLYEKFIEAVKLWRPRAVI